MYFATNFRAASHAASVIAESYIPEVNDFLKIHF